MDLIELLKGGVINVLRVPLRLDALHVASGVHEVGMPLADFAALPYFDTQLARINEHIPNISEEARNLPFHDRSLALPKGVHLHWALPDALTVGQTERGAEGATTEFPPVPDRWLIRRSLKGTVQRQWIVESDYLHPLDATTKVPTYQQDAAWPDGKPNTIPTERITFVQDHVTYEGAAFRYMGRFQSLQEWQTSGNQGDYLNSGTFSSFKLTAVGWGEPAFAAYYPNCYSIFGFCDNDAFLSTADEYDYEVIGWYQETALDCLQAARFTGLTSDQAKYEALLNGYGWTVPDADLSQAFPTLTVCYGSLTFAPQQVGPAAPSSTVGVAVGNTGGEALAAVLAKGVADELGADAKAAIEDQLEAVNLSARLRGQTSDFSAIFRQSRHQRGFAAVEGGTIWAVLPRKAVAAATAAQAADDQSPQPTLPDSAAHALNQLNQAQEDYDRATQELAELRYQLFSDWYKFMLVDHSTEPDLQGYKDDLGNLVDFINDSSLKLVQERMAFCGLLAFGADKLIAKDPTGATVAALTLSSNVLAPAAPAVDSLAVQVLVRLHALRAEVQSSGLAGDFRIVQQPGQPFYQPAEPVVLLSGDVAVSTPRHGVDGLLPCAVVALTDAPGTAGFFTGLAAFRPAPASPDGQVALQKQSTPPWNPILLEWDVDVYPVTARLTVDPSVPGNERYDADYLVGNYELPAGAFDFTPRTTPSTTNPNRYSGRCVMTPHASTVVTANLSDYLQHVTLDDCRDRAVTAAHLDDYVDQLIAWYKVEHPSAQAPATAPEKLDWLRTQRPFQVVAGGLNELMAPADMKAWYPAKPIHGNPNPHFPTFGSATPEQQAADPIYTAILATVQVSGMQVLSQSLAGFNAALMTRSQTFQLPIDDPMELDTEDPFSHQPNPNWKLTDDVRRALVVPGPTAPQPGTTFSPLRSGMMSISALSLLDTFGQIWDADPADLAGVQVVHSNSMSSAGVQQAYLAPRFAQPARLDCRWLAAAAGQSDGNEIELDESPAASPICGWLIPNNLDNSLMVYDGDGYALGAINVLAEWTPAPGPGLRLAVRQIADPCLQRVVRYLSIDPASTDAEVAAKQGFLQGFLTTLDSALEMIEPDNYAQHKDLALLMSRPLAVARMRYELRLLGEPLVTSTSGGVLSVARSTHWKAFANENWDVFAFDWGNLYGCTYQQMKVNTCTFPALKPLAGYARTTNGFNDVQAPVRLGEYGQLGDGLVGFWLETGDGELGPRFYAPQADRAQEGINLPVTLDAAPTYVTLLLDPRAQVHATCGLLPVRTLQIPPGQYQQALKKMGVTFVTSPIVTDHESVHLPLPTEAGYQWSWVSRPDARRWEETTDIRGVTPHVHFFHPPVLLEGWLKLTPDED